MYMVVTGQHFVQPGPGACRIQPQLAAAAFILAVGVWPHCAWCALRGPIGGACVRAFGRLLLLSILPQLQSRRRHNTTVHDNAVLLLQKLQRGDCAVFQVHPGGEVDASERGSEAHLASARAALHDASISAWFFRARMHDDDVIDPYAELVKSEAGDDAVDIGGGGDDEEEEEEDDGWMDLD